MDIFDVLTMIGGLALFLYGMNVMGDALTKMSGGKLEKILEKFTTNRIKAVLLGAGVTAVIQSSSATTVMVVGFVNSGIMKLGCAVGVIMGANIGTTITSWILSLSGIDGASFILQLLKPTSFSPVLAVIGVGLLTFTKSEKKHNVGAILIGFAVLMFGMDTMSSAVASLKDVPEFTNILMKFENPAFGILAGALLTAILQSSSASMGILQTLSLTGAVSYGTAIPIILGQNIGTCVTAILSSIGASRDAKRTAVVHFYFNFIGTLLFVVVFYGLNFFLDFSSLESVTGPAGVAMMHTAFNVAATVVLFPMAGLLEKLAIKTIKDKSNDRGKDEDETLQLLDPLFLDQPGFAIMQCKKVADQMTRITKEGILDAMSLINKYDDEVAKKVKEMEDLIDKYEDDLGTYLLKLSGKDLRRDDGHTLSILLHCIGDIERISDHCVNIALATKQMYKKELSFSKKAMEELRIYGQALIDVIDLTFDAFRKNDFAKAELVQPLEEVIDDMNAELKKRHVKRLRKGKCTIELGLNLSDITDVYERISDHCSNIATSLIQIEEDDLDTHEYRKMLKTTDSEWYKQKYGEFIEKYKLP